jgi:hypothetical protein
MSDNVEEKIEQTVDDNPGGKDVGKEEEKSLLDTEHFDDNSDNLIDTVESEEDFGGIDETTGGRGKKTDDQPEEKDEETEAADKASQEEKKKPTEYELEVQRLNREKNEAIAKAKELESKLSKEDVAPDGEKIIDVSKMSNDELLDWQSEDPKGYALNLKRWATKSALSEVEIARKQEYLEKIKQQDFDKYLADNPDNEDGTGIVQMWEKGEIQKFMEEHPAYPTAVSAHMAMTHESRRKSFEAKIRKEERDRINKERRAGVVTVGLGSSPGTSFGSGDDKANEELKNTKKRGGLVASIARRHANRRNKQFG